MSDLIPIFGVLSALAMILANVAIWAPRRLRVRLAALVVAAVFLPAAYSGLTEMLARPKPVALEWARGGLEEATVLSARLREGEAIYLWLDIEGVAEPRAYALPWNEQTARQLHGARQTAERDGTGVRMRKPFEATRDDSEPLFYAPAPPPPPAKQPPAEAPLAFERSDASGPDDAVSWARR